MPDQTTLQQDILGMIIIAQFSGLSPARQVSLRDHLESFHAASGGRIRVATGCSGSDLIIHVIEELCAFWKTQFGISFSVVHEFSA